jgi:hypothetical protein
MDGRCPAEPVLGVFLGGTGEKVTSNWNCSVADSNVGAGRTNASACSHDGMCTGICASFLSSCGDTHLSQSNFEPAQGSTEIGTDAMTQLSLTRVEARSYSRKTPRLMARQCDPATIKLVTRSQSPGGGLVQRGATVEPVELATGCITGSISTTTCQCLLRATRCC